MDHLPPVSQPFKPVAVKYLGGKYGGVEHGGYRFTEFPVSSAVERVKSGILGVSQEIVDEAARVLQMRFFFGMIRELLDIPVFQDDFVRCRGNQQFVTTDWLRDYLRLWKADTDEAKKDPTGQKLALRNRRAVFCLDESINMWRSVPDFTAIVGPEIELSIQILGCTLEHALGEGAKIPVERLPWRQTRSEFLDRRMLEDGWCPAIVSQIYRPSRLVLQYYASLLGPHGIKHVGQFGCKAGDKVCDLVSKQNAPEDRASKHVCGGQQGYECCDIKPLSPGDVNSHIEEGRIPLLRYDSANAELHVVPYEEGCQYTAISHVWTDGLGNPDGNSMPRCQLDRLNGMLRDVPWTNKFFAALARSTDTWVTDFDGQDMVELSPNPEENAVRPHLFWIDTICVPRPLDARSELTNKLAINDMRLVYLRANNVIVLDSDLTHVKGNLCAEEVLTRISCTNWIRRFWTLQEAILAKMLWFRFGDNYYRPLDDHKTVEDLYDDEIGYYCPDFDFQWRSRSSALSYIQRIAMVWSGLKNRSSYLPEDQAVCIATLLDMPIHKIQDLPKKDRLRKLWSFYKSLHIGVLFVPTVREQQDTLRWAPVTLDGMDALPYLGVTKEVFPSTAGLQVRHHAIITNSRLTKTRTGVVALQIDDDVYLARENTKRDNPPWKDLRTQIDLDLTQYSRLAVILGLDDLRDSEGAPFQRSLGALVGVIETPTEEIDQSGRETIIKCQFLRVVSVLLKGSVWENQNQTWTPKDQEEKLKVTPSTFTSLDQQWLVT